ncbi:MAG: hypothetical protein ACM3UU_01400 [Ignavibacteriales bacterium]
MIKALKNIVITFTVTTAVYITGYSLINNYTFIDSAKQINNYFMNAITLKEENPLDVIKAFIEAINQNDINTATTYMDPKYEKAYNAASNISGTFFRVSLKDANDLLPVINDMNPEGGRMVWKIEKVISEKVGKNDAQYEIKFSYMFSTGKLKPSKREKTNLIRMHRFPKEGWRMLDLPEV